LAVPGVLIFIWQMVLVSRRTERRQMGVEVVGSGVLALIAPAAMWVGVGEPVQIGWLLWILVWLQSAASIVYAYLRLAQRPLKSMPSMPEKLAMGRRALIYASFNLLAAGALSVMGIVPPYLFLPYALQWLETLWGTFNPAVGKKPNSIGIRQTIVTTLFTLLFILVW
ncbi:MAG: hypothetical protein R3335_15345, partial [Anaerolineales bacterium]|nr:hypothetical protein [Anaerolineales bacterium]